MYLYILKSYYRLKVLYHAIPPFAMDLLKKGIEVLCCTSLIIRDYLYGQSHKAGEFSSCLFNWYSKCWWRDGAEEIALDEVLFSRFPGGLERQNSTTSSWFPRSHGIYRFWEWELNSCVRETPVPWRCTWHFKWCKSVEMETPNSVWKGTNLAGNQMTLPSGPSVSLPSPPVYKTCSGLYLSSVLTKPHAPSPPGFIADKSSKGGALFFLCFVT